MQQTKEELLRLAFICLGQAAKILDAAGQDVLASEGDRRAVGKGLRGRVRARRRSSLPSARRLITAENVNSPWRR
jgi:hypothetical protein